MPLPEYLPARRPDLLLHAGTGGSYVIEDHASGQCYSLGEQEYFLLSRLDGGQTAATLCAAYEARSGEPLTPAEVEEFLEVARDFLLPADASAELAASLADEIADYERCFPECAPLSRRSSQVIAGAATHDRRNFGPFPVYVDRAEGPHKWTASGHRLIDYWTGHGALLCGHGFGPVVEAVARQVHRGTHFGAGHGLEVRWAELICRLVPSAERVRFTASGTEATQLALRIARAFTGRPRVVKFQGHFHGWHDEAMVHFFPAPSAGFSPGAAEYCTSVNLSSGEEVESVLRRGDVAAVLLEPGGGTSGALPWSREQLRDLREQTRRHGTLLVFDEVISGFRYSPGGVQELTGVLPDLTTLAKILSGGLPGGAVAGRADVMAVFGTGTAGRGRRAQVPHTGTFNGNPLSSAAGVAMLEHVGDGVAQEKARRAANLLARRVNELAEAQGVDVSLITSDTSIYQVLIGGRKLGVAAEPSPLVTLLYSSHPERYARLRRSLLIEGVDSPPLHGWVSAAHDERTTEEAAAAFGRAFARLRADPGFRL